VRQQRTLTEDAVDKKTKEEFETQGGWQKFVMEISHLVPDTIAG